MMRTAKRVWKINNSGRNLYFGRSVIKKNNKVKKIIMN